MAQRLLFAVRHMYSILNQWFFFVAIHSFSQWTSILTTFFKFFFYPRFKYPPQKVHTFHCPPSFSTPPPPLKLRESSPKPLEPAGDQHGAQHARCSLTPVNSRPDQGCRQCVMSQFCDIKYINRIQHKRHTFNVKIMSSPGHSGIL